MTKQQIFDKATQILLPVLTILGFFLTSAKKPELGIPIQLASQVFWLYSAWQAYKKAGQIGILITALLLTAILIYGTFNYWLF